MKSLGIFIATPGRRSLWRTLQSIGYQTAPIEDVLVVGDGYHAPTEDLCIAASEIFALPVRYVATRKTRDWGHSQQNYALQHVRGDYIIYQDDDDIFVPRALNTAAELINQEDEPVAFIGRVKTPCWGLLWQVPSPIDAVLDGHCMLLPNDKKRLGWLTSGYNGDQAYIHISLRNFKRWKWVDRVWTLTRPHWGLCIGYEQERKDSWVAEIRRGDIDGPRVAVVSLDKTSDTYHATLKECEVLSSEEYGDIAEMLMYASQGGDLTFRTNDPVVIDAFTGKNYKEHLVTQEYTELVHDWPPDFWPPLPKEFNLLIDPDTGQVIPDWRDKVWGGGKVIE